MPRDIELLTKRNEQIRGDFNKLSAEGLPMRWNGNSTKVALSTSQIFLLLRDKYHLATRTLEDIIYPPTSGGKAVAPAARTHTALAA